MATQYINASANAPADIAAKSTNPGFTAANSSAANSQRPADQTKWTEFSGSVSESDATTTGKKQLYQGYRKVHTYNIWYSLTSSG